MNEKLNLIENEEMLQKDKKTKTIMIVIIALIVVLLIISIVLIYLISTVQNSRLSLTIDNKSQDFASDMFIMQDDELYIDIKAFASLMNYESYNGDLKTRYSEDTTKCYICPITDSASFESTSNPI